MSDNFDDFTKAAITAGAAQGVDEALAQARAMGTDPIVALDGLIMSAKEMIVLAEEAKEQIQKEREK